MIAKFMVEMTLEEFNDYQKYSNKAISKTELHIKALEKLTEEEKFMPEIINHIVCEINNKMIIKECNKVDGLWAWPMFNFTHKEDEWYKKVGHQTLLKIHSIIDDIYTSAGYKVEPRGNVRPCLVFYISKK